MNKGTLYVIFGILIAVGLFLAVRNDRPTISEQMTTAEQNVHQELQKAGEAVTAATDEIADSAQEGLDQAATLAKNTMDEEGDLANEATDSAKSKADDTQDAMAQPKPEALDSNDSSME